MPLVLLVEDNPMNRKLFRDIMEMRFDVLEAETAEIALELLERHKPDLILLDIQLPGMDGLSFLRLIKKDPARADIPVVALSAHALQEDIRQALACGCREYVTKPLVEDPIAFAERMARVATDQVCT
jgi:two-component system cell cycle response regulator DivK